MAPSGPAGISTALFVSLLTAHSGNPRPASMGILSGHSPTSARDPHGDSATMLTSEGRPPRWLSTHSDVVPVTKIHMDEPLAMPRGGRRWPCGGFRRNVCASSANTTSAKSSIWCASSVMTATTNKTVSCASASLDAVGNTHDRSSDSAPSHDHTLPFRVTPCSAFFATKRRRFIWSEEVASSHPAPHGKNAFHNTHRKARAGREEEVGRMRQEKTSPSFSLIDPSRAGGDESSLQATPCAKKKISPQQRFFFYHQTTEGGGRRHQQIPPPMPPSMSTGAHERIDGGVASTCCERPQKLQFTVRTTTQTRRTPMSNTRSTEKRGGAATEAGDIARNKALRRPR
jgi:hypothetical protein